MKFAESIVKSRVFFYTLTGFFLAAVVYANYQYVTTKDTPEPQPISKNRDTSVGLQQAAVGSSAVTTPPVEVVIKEIEPEPEWILTPLEVTEFPHEPTPAESITKPAEIVEVPVLLPPPPPVVAISTSTPAVDEFELSPTPIQIVVTPSPANLCGNGVQDAGEQCDDANLNNNDSCLNNCQAARCGDGFLNSAYEQCDDNNDNNKDSCTNQCLNYVPEQ